MTSKSSSPPEPMSRKEFFVDTKTTCFLCLNDIPSSPPVIDLENDEEDDNQDSNLEGEKFYMKPIFRYLNINLDTLFEKQLTLYDSTKLPNKITDWKVLLCRECISHANRVSELCLQLEMIQMKMNHSINLFQRIIENSEKDACKLEKIRGISKNPMDTLHATIADLLRNETREKCNSHFKKSSPKVNVKIIEETSTSAKIIPQSTVSLPPPPPSTLPQNVLKPGNLKCKICNSPFGAIGGLSAHMQRRHPEFNGNPPSITKVPSPDKQNKISPIKRSEFIQQKGRYKCHICKSTYMLASSLRRHMRKQHTNNSISGRTLTCNKCGLQLPSRPEWIKHTRLQCLFRRNNTTSPQEQPALILDNPPPQLHPLPPPPPPISVGSETPLTTVNLSKMIDSIPHLKTGNDGLLCALCPLSSSTTPNEVFQREDLLRRHMFLNHLDYFFGPVKLPEVSSEQFKIFCKEIVENDMKPTQNTGSPGSGRFGSLTFACTHCSSTFYEKRAMNAHLIRSHYSILAPKLVDLQRNQGVSIMDVSPMSVDVPVGTATSSNKWNCEDCSRMFRTVASLNIHRRYHCQARNLHLPLSYAGESPMTPLIDAHLERIRIRKRRTEHGYPGKHRCAECELTFAHRTSLLRHRSSTNHKIDIFESSQQSVSEVAIPCDIETTAYFDPPQWTCQHCGKKFSCSSSMYRHQRENCPVILAKAKEGMEDQSGVTIVMEGDHEQNYFYEENEQEMGVEEHREEYEEEAYPESYVNTKIEVIEMGQVQIPKIEDGQGVEDVYQDNLMVTEGDGGEEEMILP